MVLGETELFGIVNVLPKECVELVGVERTETVRYCNQVDMILCLEPYNLCTVGERSAPRMMAYNPRTIAMAILTLPSADGIIRQL